MRRATRLAIVAAGTVLLESLRGVDAAPPPPNEPPPAATTTNGIRLRPKRATLENGLRVVLLPDATSPTVAIDLVYAVGARNEARGRAGFAHLFEHMMFQGSAHVRRGDHFKLVTRHGGIANGTTNEDRTRYYDVLPAGELALGLWLEADRMKALDLSRGNFENQRSVVKEELRMRVENAAYASASIRLQELAYQGYWPYEHPAMGTIRDLDAADLPWIRGFYDDFYAPNNAVLAIAGDFDEEAAMHLVRAYFADAPRKTVPKLEDGVVPPQVAPRTSVLEDPHASLPALFLGWVVPPSVDRDHYALELAANLLGDGESSRLPRGLVHDRGLAVHASAETDGLRGPDLFHVTVKLARHAKVDAVEKLVLAELADLGARGPTDDELAKVKTRARASFLFALQSNGARAARLAEIELFRGDATAIDAELDRYLAVTKEDIRRVVATYLAPRRRSVVVVRPGQPPPVGATGSARAKT